MEYKVGDDGHISVQLELSDLLALGPTSVGQDHHGSQYLASAYIVATAGERPNHYPMLRLRCAAKEHSELVAPYRTSAQEHFTQHGILMDRSKRLLEITIDEHALDALRRTGKFVYRNGIDSVRIEAENYSSNTSEWRVAA